MMRHRLIASMALCAVLAGCGGGGSRAPLDETVRQLSTTSGWRYLITGSISGGAHKQPVHISGGLTVMTTSDTVITPWLQQAHVLVLNGELVKGAASETIAERVYYVQDANGSISFVGGEKPTGVYWTSDDFDRAYLLVKSPLSVGQTWTTHVKTTAGVEYDDYYVVQGTENIDVPGGGFRTFRVARNGQVSKAPVTAVYWWAPRTGTYVQMEQTTAGTGGGVERLVYKLVSTL